MRKITALLLILLLLFALAGCAFPPGAPVNEIRPLELTEREKSLIGLIGANNMEILLFAYDVSEPCARFEAWVEVYEKGELVADWPAGLDMSDAEPRPWRGTLAVTIQKSPAFVWGFAAGEEDGGRVSQTSEPFPLPESTQSVRGHIADPVTVEPGEEIVLYSAIYSSSDTVIAYSEESYADPENIAKQEYLQLIKCRFGGES